MCGQAPRAINLRSVSILDASLDSDNAALKKYPELTVDLQINSRPFAKMIIDTGADETILNEDTWQKLGSPPMQNTTKNVRAYGGGKYELLGSVLLDVSMQGSPPLQLTAYVVQADDRRQVANDQCRATMPRCGSRLSNCRSRNCQGCYSMSGYEIY
ncbi:gag-polyprotein putative aspartyl protease domain-containing protein [Ditylenchus destructor]|uniref:Gag-polyprotein putative aspartyl protease domain-containing protein n=1 Tax=Ditylenchus destructor TaxID=166010 RepID=A0AAD4NJ95_9BILA|nr:gag-polyprotein putative aspartyl protease domain-containing protein [Ditylenchus destructor]